ncbi:MAG: hypothetical protein KDE09_00725 [Anaerolineales bacterium]|nr:hypothetical protein [Anaerolineales bacterium]
MFRQKSPVVLGLIALLALLVLAPAGHGAPAVLSLVLPAHLDSYQLGRALLDRGYQISFASRYLIARNVIQLCFFSPVRREQLWPMIHILEQAL